MSYSRETTECEQAVARVRAGTEKTYTLQEALEDPGFELDAQHRNLVIVTLLNAAQALILCWGITVALGIWK